MIIENEVYKKNSEFLDAVSKAKHDFEENVAEAFGLNGIVELRRKISLANRENRAILVELAKKMKEEGKSTNEIAIELGKNESSVRLLLCNDFSNDDLEREGITFEQIKEEMEEFRKTHKTVPINVEVTKV